MAILITCDAMYKVLCPKVLVRKKKLPYGCVFLLLLCVEKIPIFQGYWRYCVSMRLSQLFLLLIL